MMNLKFTAFALFSLLLMTAIASKIDKRCVTKTLPTCLASEEVETIIKSWTQEQKRWYQVYAVGVGSSVQVSSVDRWNGKHFWLDYTHNNVLAWCPRLAVKGDWIQVSIDQPRYWTNVIIQGRADHTQWVTSFKVTYSLEGQYWYDVDDGKTFEGNNDKTTKKMLTFGQPVYARVLRIYPQTWHDWPCLRFDAIYINCQSQWSRLRQKDSLPTNIQYGYAVAENQCPVSYESAYNEVKNYLLDNTQKEASAWAAKQSKTGTWIQVGCNNLRQWIGVIMQGRGDYDQWVKTIKIATSVDGKTWQYVQNGKIFQVNDDKNTKVRITFDKPILAKIVRIYPQTWHNWISLRFDALYLKQK